MSTGPAYDPNLVEQTRLQIRAMIAEITQLAKSDIPPEKFHSEIVPKIVTALAAIGGAIWTVDTRGALTLGFQVNMQELRLGESEDASKMHSRLLYKMLASNDPATLMMPRSSTEGDENVGNPTDCLLVFAPIKTELETVGLIEVAQRADTGPVAQKGYLKFLEQMGGVAADFYKNRQLRNFGERQTLWTLLEEFTRTIHKTLDFRETAYTVANEGRRLIECDRVSVAITHGGKCRIESVSGQDMVDKRSTTVKLLSKLATAVVKCNEPIWYTGDTSDFAPQVEKAVEDYVDESHTKMVAVFPLTKKRLEEVAEEDINAREKPLPPFGALIVEQIEDSRIPERMKKRVEIVADHACSALGNSMDHNSVFLMPLWRTIGKSKVLVTARMLPKTISVSVAIIALLLILLFVPYPFNMSADGRLEPIEKCKVFAEIPGIVEEIYVEPYSYVNAGDPIMRCRSPELERRKEALLGDRGTNQKEYESLKKLINDPGASRERRTDLMIKQQEIEEKLKTNNILLQLLNEESAALTIRAPISGIVAKQDLKQDLLNRTVSGGVSLLEIANTDIAQPWKLEIEMPEKRVGYVLDYLKGMQKSDPNAALDVDFVLASNTEVTYKGKVYEVHPRAETRGEGGAAGGGNTVLIRASIIDQNSLPSDIRLGTSCKAKVKCGKQPMGFVFFHEAIAAFRRHVIFRFF
ncbi:MAG: efflux RND transporter periplasmic adaptor subunit [Thermoguttaceae bacterium]